jgi:hypothetical protein
MVLLHPREGIFMDTDTAPRANVDPKEVPLQTP